MNGKKILAAAVISGAIAAFGMHPASALTLVQTTRASVASDGTQGTQQSNQASISGDARLVAFSTASALVPQDTNGLPDVYVHDRQSGTTELISATSGGSAGNDVSGEPHISTGGRFVVFDSKATNLTSGVTNHVRQVYVRDLTNGTTFRASIARNGAMPNGDSTAMDVSDLGNVVAFKSNASNLVSNDANPGSDFFVRQSSLGQTIRLDTQTSGSAVGHTIDLTPDGRFVVFTSQSRQFSLDTNSFPDVYRRDLQNGAVFLVSRAHTPVPNGRSFDPSISSDGSRVTFESCATNLVNGDTNGHCDVFVRDISSLSFIRITNGNADSENPVLSSDGRVVAWDSAATNLLSSSDTNGHFDIFGRLVTNGTTNRVSVSTDGTPGNRDSLLPALSSNGDTVAWESAATNLVSGDTNNVSDVFVNGAPA